MFQQLEILSIRSPDIRVGYPGEIRRFLHSVRLRVRRESGLWLTDARGILRDELLNGPIQIGRGSWPPKARCAWTSCFCNMLQALRR